MRGLDGSGIELTGRHAMWPLTLTGVEQSRPDDVLVPSRVGSLCGTFGMLRRDFPSHTECLHPTCTLQRLVCQPVIVALASTTPPRTTADQVRGRILTTVSAQHCSGLTRWSLLATVLSLARVASGGKPGNPDDAAWAEYGDRNTSSAPSESRKRALPGFVDTDEVGAASSAVAALLADPTMPKVYRYFLHSPRLTRAHSASSCCSEGCSLHSSAFLLKSPTA